MIGVCFTFETVRAISFAIDNGADLSEVLSATAAISEGPDIFTFQNLC